MITQFETFLLELAPLLQFQTLAPDQHGACLVIIKADQTALLFEFDELLVPNTVLVSTPISSIPNPYLREAYEAALLGNGNMEETLSIKPDEEILYLHRRFSPNIQSKDLEPLILHFLETARVWRENVKEFGKQPPSEEQPFPGPTTIQVFPYKA